MHGFDGLRARSVLPDLSECKPPLGTELGTVAGPISVGHSRIGHRRPLSGASLSMNPKQSQAFVAGTCTPVSIYIVRNLCKLAFYAIY